jgi:hypothetical protein
MIAGCTKGLTITIYELTIIIIIIVVVVVVELGKRILNTYMFLKGSDDGM